MIDALLQTLRGHADPTYRARIRDHFRMDVSHFLGVPTPMVRKISGQQARTMKALSLDEVLAQCDALLQTGLYECRIIAFDLAWRRRKALTPAHFSLFERWLHSYVDDWSDCDDLCTHPLGYLLAQYPALAANTRSWTSSSNRWVRRGSAVSLIYGLRRGLLLEDTLQNAEALLTETDDLVRKGYGWMLKEAGKSFPEKLPGFLLKHRNSMPRMALRYAVAKLPPEQRQRVLHAGATQS